MATSGLREVLCRIRVNMSLPSSPHQCNGVVTSQLDLHSNVSTELPVSLHDLNNSFDIPMETRLQWANETILKFRGLSDVHHHHHHDIRPWDLVLNLNGSVENVAKFPPELMVPECLPPTESQLQEYPSRYRLPTPISNQISSKLELTRRTENFALGSLLYELISSKRPFQDDEDDRQIQSKYIKGEFPEDVWGLPLATIILSCWCERYAKEDIKSETFLGRTHNYVTNHPILFSVQLIGGVASIASLAVVPILGAVGFAATGPVVGSAAAAWQASIGVVQAGSLFAWCQSVAMGGAAAGGIIATGVSGATVAAGSGVLNAVNDRDDGDQASQLKEKFLIAWNQEVWDENNIRARL